jgi:hypothetical protein
MRARAHRRVAEQYQRRVPVKMRSRAASGHPARGLSARAGSSGAAVRTEAAPWRGIGARPPAQRMARRAPAGALPPSRCGEPPRRRRQRRSSRQEVSSRQGASTGTPAGKRSRPDSLICRQLPRADLGQLPFVYEQLRRPICGSYRSACGQLPRAYLGKRPLACLWTATLVYGRRPRPAGGSCRSPVCRSPVCGRLPRASR